VCGKTHIGMLQAQKTLSEAAGRDFFKKLLGAKVRDGEGAYVGYLKRVYLDRKSGRAKRLVVRMVDGSLLVVDPKDAFLSGSGEIVLKSKVRVAAPDFANELRRLEGAVGELRGIREKLLDLDEALIAGELSKDTYACFREALEQRRRQLLAEIRELLEKLEAQLHKLEEERDALLLKLNGAKKEDYAQLLKRIKEVRDSMLRVYELVESARHEIALEMELEDFLRNYLKP
jgi:sporulation protein YlmC with PRC-barrel domain